MQLDVAPHSLAVAVKSAFDPAGGAAEGEPDLETIGLAVEIGASAPACGVVNAEGGDRASRTLPQRHATLGNRARSSRSLR